MFCQKLLLLSPIFNLSSYFTAVMREKPFEEKYWQMTEDSGVRLLHCLSCPYKTAHSGNMKAHVNSRHNPNPIIFDCPHCPYSAKQRRSLKNHLVVKHNIK
jgi:hypothetical protein